MTNFMALEGGRTFVYMFYLRGYLPLKYQKLKRKFYFCYLKNYKSHLYKNLNTCIMISTLLNFIFKKLNIFHF